MSYVARWLFLLLLCTGWQGSAEGIQARGTRSGYKEWISDGRFRHGLALSALSPVEVMEHGGFARTNQDTLRFDKHGEQLPPAWQACQWWSRHNLAHRQQSSSPWGQAYGNAGKTIALSHDGTLTLEIKTDSEYLHPRRQGENWPHLLIQQDMGQGGISLGESKELRLRMDLRLLYCESLMDPEDFSEDLHTAQSPFYLYLRNANPHSTDFGKCLWLGITAFDARWTQMPESETVSWDIGTQMYIYQIPAASVWGRGMLSDHKWHRMEADLLPWVAQALKTFHLRGLFAATEVKDMVVTGMNFGWEVPGTYNAALQLRKLSLRSR